MTKEDELARLLLFLLILIVVGSAIVSVAVKRDFFTGVSLLLGLPLAVLELMVSNNSSTVRERGIDFDALARGIDAERERQANDRSE